MFYKQCTGCNQVLYSAVDSGKWRCPYCNEDITLMKAYRSTKGERLSYSLSNGSCRRGKIDSVFITKSGLHGI